MWYIYPTEKWINEVVKLINEEQLNPEDSRFMIAFFSSMDFEFVDYFKTYKKQISSYSGANFHIFTPFIYEDSLVPDDQMRYMANEFRALGIPIQTNPTFVFFKLEKRGESYEPNFFSGFELPTFNNFHVKLKEAIYYSSQTTDTGELERILMRTFGVRNIVDNYSIGRDLKDVISHKLPKSKIFVSHSSVDKPFVRKLISTLSGSDLNFWIDEKEISGGDDIQYSISENLRASNFLIAVISKDSVNSKWVKFELSQFMGIADNRNIIPIIIDKGEQFDEPIDNIIRRLKYLDFSDESNWDKNIVELKRLLTKKV
ncbi:toll/interleukin-1 receptor domain-containing protein [Paraflavisolibacter sp. H34]|uniref:toll/interleukin-1 receptor domain-containing protein n=1 Tax=Huijunlia imazamoxiresistens TaxID=3127457 RepID=UPI00301AAFCC